MDSGFGEDDILTQAAWIVGERYAQLELKAARSLIQDAFALLPWDLQDDYRDIQELHQAGRFQEANRAWEQWMAKARDMGLI
jgi:hypothetical protein